MATGQAGGVMMGACMDRHFYIHSLTVQQFRTRREGMQLRPELELRELDDECRHGRLEGDRTPPCGCFPAEGGVLVQLPVFVRAGETWRRVA
jgi:hypothetical protein